MLQRPCDPIQLRDHNDVEAAVLDDAYQCVETGTRAERTRHSPVHELLDNMPTRRISRSPAAFDLTLERGSPDLILGGHAGVDRDALVYGLVHDHLGPVWSTRSPRATADIHAAGQRYPPGRGESAVARS
jgi:hypothetical protein